MGFRFVQMSTTLNGQNAHSHQLPKSNSLWVQRLAHVSFGGVAVARTLIFDWRTFLGLHHDAQLTDDLRVVNRPLCVSQHGKLSHSSSWLSKLHLGVHCYCYAYMCGGAIWAVLTELKADMVLFAGNTV